MAEITATPITANPITAVPITAVQVGDTSTSNLIFTFNGDNQYAVMAAGWAPKGYPFSASIQGTPTSITTTERRMWSVNGTVTDILLTGRFDTSATHLYSGRYRPNPTGTNVTVNSGVSASPGDKVTFKIEAGPAGATPYINGVAGSTNASVPLWDANEIELIGAGDELATSGSMLWHGTLQKLTLTDGSPIQHTQVTVGDGAVYVYNAGTAINCSTMTSFEWDGIFQTGTQVLMGNNALTYGIVITATEVQTYSSGLLNPGVGTHALLPGQHYRGKVVFSPGPTQPVNTTFYIDGEEIGTGTAGLTNWTAVSRLTGTTTTLMPVGAACQNIKITTEDGTYHYVMDEASGVTIPNVGTTGTGYNFRWSTSIARTTFADRSRYYPMNEGAGDTFFCYDGNGTALPAGDATIYNSGAASGGWTARAIVSPYVAYGLTGGAVAGLIDSAGNGGNLVSGGTGTPFADNVTYTPNGTNNYLSVTSDAYLDSLFRMDTLGANSEQLIIAFKLQTNGTFSAIENIIGWGRNDTTGGLWIGYSATGQLQIINRGENAATAATTSVQQSSLSGITDPMYMVFSIEGTAAATADALIYLNGIAFTSVTGLNLNSSGTGPIGTSAGPFVIGARKTAAAAQDRYLGSGTTAAQISDVLVLRRDTINIERLGQFAVYFYELGNAAAAAKRAGL